MKSRAADLGSDADERNGATGKSGTDTRAESFPESSIRAQSITHHGEDDGTSVASQGGETSMKPCTVDR